MTAVLNAAAMAHAADIEEMCCFQCEYTVKPSGCFHVGVCSKTPYVAALYDLLIYGCALSSAPNEQRVAWLFSTLTNVNFDQNWFLASLHEMSLKTADEHWQAAYNGARYGDTALIRCTYSPDASLKTQGATVGGLRQFGIQGVKGACAYAQHIIEARALLQSQKRDENFDAALNKLFKEFEFLCLSDCTDVEQVLAHLLAVGAANYEIVRLLDLYNREVGQGQHLTTVSNTPKPGHCVLVSGHDYAILARIVDACTAYDINVYTHGELFAASSYPRFSGLAGNFGGAWYKQYVEFALFPGPIVLTSNCLMRPNAKYAENVFSASVVGYEGIKRLDFTQLIDRALEMPGFQSVEQCERLRNQMELLPSVSGVGMSHSVFQSVRSKLAHLLQEHVIENLVFIGGCDGHNAKRSAFRYKAIDSAPNDLILTGACGRFRINDIDFGTIGDIPRLIDVGQCNDVVSLLWILGDIAKEVPDIMSRVKLYVSWYEQKAVVYLLMLLSYGVRGIQIGPTAPVALSHDALSVLKQKFGVELIH